MSSPRILHRTPSRADAASRSERRRVEPASKGGRRESDARGVGVSQRSAGQVEVALILAVKKGVTRCGVGGRRTSRAVARSFARAMIDALTRPLDHTDRSSSPNFTAAAGVFGGLPRLAFIRWLRGSPSFSRRE